MEIQTQELGPVETSQATLDIPDRVPKEQTAIGEPDEVEPDISKGEAIAVSYGSCPYVDQCNVGDQTCAEAEPEMKEIRQGHQVACFKV